MCGHMFPTVIELVMKGPISDPEYRLTTRTRHVCGSETLFVHICACGIMLRTLHELQLERYI